MPVALIAIVAGSIGALLLFLGLRGRRLGDHPFCRGADSTFSGNRTIQRSVPNAARG